MWKIRLKMTHIIFTTSFSCRAKFTLSTSQLRTLEYLKSCNKSIENSEEKKIRDLMTTDINSNMVDLELCLKIKRWTLNETLLLLNIWCLNLKKPSVIIESIFFQIFLENLKSDKWKDITWIQKVQIIHFLSWLKLEEKDIHLLISKFLLQESNYLNANFKDVCIVADAIYKTNTKAVPTKFKVQVSSLLRERLYELSEQQVWFSMAIKFLHFQKCYEPELLKDLSNMIKESKNFTEQLTFVSLCHILNLFAGGNFRDVELLEIFAKKGMKEIEQTRPKYINSFLWGLAILDFSLEDRDVKQIVIPLLMSKIRIGIFKSHYHYLIDSNLSLFMMGYLDFQLLVDSITEDGVRKVKDEPNSINYLHRLVQLLEWVNFEYPFLLTTEQQNIRQNLSYVMISKGKMSDSPAVKNLMTKLISVQETFDFKNCIIEKPVPRLHILGVTCNVRGKNLHIDVLDKSNCFYDSCIPYIYMKLKIRLMKKLPTYKHIVIKELELNELQTHAETEIFFKNLFNKITKYTNNS